MKSAEEWAEEANLFDWSPVDFIRRVQANVVESTLTELVNLGASCPCDSPQAKGYGIACDEAYSRILALKPETT